MKRTVLFSRENLEFNWFIFFIFHFFCCENFEMVLPCELTNLSSLGCLENWRKEACFELLRFASKKWSTTFLVNFWIHAFFLFTWSEFGRFDLCYNNMFGFWENWNEGRREVWKLRDSRSLDSKGQKTSLDFLYLVRIHNKNPERKKVKSHRFIRVCWIILE